LFFIFLCVHLLGAGKSVYNSNLVRPKVALLVTLFVEVTKDLDLLEQERNGPFLGTRGQD
jgi:hypothetical protein